MGVWGQRPDRAPGERPWASRSRFAQFPQHLFGSDEPAGLKVFLRSSQRPVQRGAVAWVEPVARIEGQELNLRSLRELCRLVHKEPTFVNTGLESHAKSLPQVCSGMRPAEGGRIGMQPRFSRAQGEMTVPSAAYLEIPQDILDSARLSIDQLRVELAVHLYEQCRLSVGKAHELAGLSLWEFRQLRGARRIPPRFEFQDFERDLSTLRAIWGPAGGLHAR